MSYIKLSQIASWPEDITQVGAIYLENEDGLIINNFNPQFPLTISAEIINWVSQEEKEKHGATISFNAEIVIVSDQSMSIRQSVFNQLIGKYPSLVM